MPVDKVSVVRHPVLMSHRTWTDEEEAVIVQEYKAGLGTAEILQRHGGTKSALLRMVKRHGVPTQPGGRRRREWEPEQVSRMADLWDQGWSQARIAREFGTTQVIVSRLLIKAGREPGPRSWNRRGDAHPSWGGGVTKTGDGYLLQKVDPQDPMFVMANRMGYVPQHRLVMARFLGRPLESRESVHHINGVKQDNRLENLQLRSNNHGKGVALMCNHCGSTDIVTVPLTED